MARTPPDSWAVLEQLLQTLADATSSTRSIQATVQAAAEAVGADVAFWYSRQSGKTLAVGGPQPMDADWCGKLAVKVLADMPDADEVKVWADRTPPSGQPSAALVCRSPRTHGCLIAAAFDPARRFDSADAKAAKFALKLLVTQRAQSQAAVKQLLVGLLHSLTTIIDAKDPYTAGHSERVARIATLVAGRMGLSDAQTGDVYLAGLLHDVGKIGVPDAILQKPGKLTADEFEEVRQHPVIGERVVASIKPFDRLRGAVRHHHERYDGGGYPDNLSGEGIPLLARVLAVADACDAMMSARRYRPARSPLDIDAIFHREAGRQFDPTVIAAFLAVRHQIYPPVYQKGLGESAAHAIDNMVENLTEATAVKLPLPAK